MPKSVKKAYLGNKNEYLDKNGRVRRVRKVVPKFDALFLPKREENIFEDSMDDFKLPTKKNKKRTTGEILFSKNETFDNLLKSSENIRQTFVDVCSNSKLTSSECDSSASSIHFLSPLDVSGENKHIPSRNKYTSPDIFSDSALIGKSSSSASKEYEPGMRKNYKEVRVILSPVKMNLNQQRIVLHPDSTADLIGRSPEADCIFTSTPAVSRIAKKSYLTRLNHISPMEKDVCPSMAVHFADSVDYRQKEFGNGSSVYLSARDNFVTPSKLGEPNVLSSASVNKARLKDSTSRKVSIGKRKGNCTGSMLHSIWDKKGERHSKRNTWAHNATNQDIQTANEDCNISVNLQLIRAKNWKRTLRKTVHQMPEAFLLLKAVSGEHDEVDNLHSRSLLQSLPISPDKSVVIKSEESCFLDLCDQSEPLPLRKFFPKSTLKLGKKIGEGIYGEVFAIKKSIKSEDSSVVKLIPIEGYFTVNEEPQKTFKEISSELIVSQAVSRLMEGDNCCHNFPLLLNAKCLQGKYTPELMKLWDKFNKQKGSENNRPNIFPKEQLYLLLEFNHAGEDLETYEFSNAMQGYSVFQQVAYALGTAEEGVQFEHRDLHWGNILIKDTEQTQFIYRMNGQEYEVKSRRLKATIIDFTLSRLMDKNCVYFNDLSKDPTLFIAEGEYQFDIYRQMRKHNKNQWAEFNPKTNILWLHYLLTKLINECRYKNKSSKVHNKFMTLLKQTEKEILLFESALQFVTR